MKNKALVILALSAFALTSCVSTISSENNSYSTIIIPFSSSSSSQHNGEESSENFFSSEDSSSESSTSSEDSSSSDINSSTSEESSSSNTSVSSDSGSSASEQQSGSSQSSSSIEDDRDYLEVETDENDYYYVGETLSKIKRFKMVIHYKGKTTDVTNRATGLTYEIKDLQGNSLDISKPFEKAGTYKLKVIANNSRITIPSDEITIEVKDSPTKELKEKSILPEHFTYYDFENSCLDNLSFPTKGEVNALVIPVEITDYPFNNVGYGENYPDAIDVLFNGDGEKDTKYWESISSYYKKTSMNQLSLNFEIADVYKPGYDSTKYINGGIGSAFTIATRALSDYKDKNGNDATKKFDNDGDGYVDGLWLVYSAPPYFYKNSAPYGGAQGSDVFWAFCSDYSGLMPNKNSPTLHSFGWASLCFANEKVDAPKVDAHTFIHETGHLLSLPDYYSYDIQGARASGAQGGLAMMDYNIGDQDSFSKIALGWANPYVPTEDCVITIKPNESTGDCILLADSWNGTAFDEYILLDLQTPSGLNELDATTKYDDYTPKYYSVPGIRMYHIDARLGEFKYVTTSEDQSITQNDVIPIKNEGQSDYYLTDDLVKALVQKGSVSTLVKDSSISYAERASGYTAINANSSSRAKIQSNPYMNNRLITLLGADGKLCEKADVKAGNDSLFKEGDSWTINGNSLGMFSTTEGFNNKDNFSYVISVLKCSNEEATIQIRKVN